MLTDPEVGSRWYVWGDHYEVVELLTNEDDPRVRLRRKDGRRVLPCNLRSFVLRAVPSQATFEEVKR